ncbi:PD40 domain-containing protein, partial [Klebsiella pneumoniae]|uniref:TolB family protein n=1 Tax=Klebsiella pneumoniae TaxID=573 RepID=UPI00163D43EA
LNTKTEETGGNCVYPYWHPSGEYVVYSVNQTIQAVHAIRERRIEVIDLASDIVVYHPQSKQLLTNDLLRTDAFETFPSFSPDGRTLYFSSSQS